MSILTVCLASAAAGGMSDPASLEVTINITRSIRVTVTCEDSEDSAGLLSTGDEDAHLVIAPPFLRFTTQKAIVPPHAGKEPGTPGGEPADGGKFLTLNVQANYDTWEVRVKFKNYEIVHQTDPRWTLGQDRFYFQVVRPDEGPQLGLKHYKQFPARGTKQVVRGEEYEGPEKKLYFLFDGKTDWMSFLSGEYKGTMVFTVQDL